MSGLTTSDTLPQGTQPGLIIPRLVSQQRWPIFGTFDPNPPRFALCRICGGLDGSPLCSSCDAKEGVDLTGQQSLKSSPLLEHFPVSLIRAAYAHWPLGSSQWTVCSTNRSCFREADINAGLKEGSGTLSQNLTSLTSQFPSDANESRVLLVFVLFTLHEGYCPLVAGYLLVTTLLGLSPVSKSSRHSVRSTTCNLQRTMKQKSNR